MPRIVDGETFLTTGEAAKRLGVHPKTLRQWATQNGHGGAKIESVTDPINGRLYFKESVVDELIEKFIKSATK